MTDAAQRVPGQLPDFPGAVVHSGVIYTSGVVDESALHGLGRSSVEQIDGALDGLIAIVEAAGGTAATILRVEAYLASSEDLEAWAATFRARWPENPPARTTLITHLALPTLRVELQAIAGVNA